MSPNIFQKKKPYRLYLAISLAIALIVALVLRLGVIGGIIMMALPFVGLFLLVIFRNPQYGLLSVYIVNYFVLGITRYVPAPLGLLIDFLLVLTFLSYFFKTFYKKHAFKPAKSTLTLLAGIWFGYSVFQLVNPETVSRAAWFYAMRGMSLYMFLTIPLTFILFRDVKYLYLFIKLWAVFSLLGTAKGLMQYTMGVDPFEQRWLNAGGAVTHLLFGKLRIFSFFSDAGQFGATQGHASVVFGIIALFEENRKKKLIWITVATLALLSLAISGTRGAFAVPVAGLVLFLLLSKNIKLLATGLVLGILVFSFFKYTSIAQGNYEVRRIRTALDPNNPSLQARLENQQKLKVYLKSRPFGGGLGSAGNWGKRFSPGTFLAETPTDSWFVAIWAEQGIVGLMLHLCILFFILIRSCFIIMTRLKNKKIRSYMIALASGYFGIMAASYGNGVLGQMPTGIIIYMSMAFLFMSEDFDRQQNELEEKKIQNLNVATPIS